LRAIGGHDQVLFWSDFPYLRRVLAANCVQKREQPIDRTADERTNACLAGRSLSGGRSRPGAGLVAPAGERTARGAAVLSARRLLCLGSAEALRHFAGQLAVRVQAKTFMVDYLRKLFATLKYG
jgi:hypothetical protein